MRRHGRLRAIVHVRLQYERASNLGADPVNGGRVVPNGVRGSVLHCWAELHRVAILWRRRAVTARGLRRVCLLLDRRLRRPDG